jgi:phosphoribosyl 1,2-cyclic phosphate phosphodiesterase
MIGGEDGAGDWGKCDPAEPKNFRSRSSIVVESTDNKALLVDTTPDLRRQLLACRIQRIDGILFTHAHADHIAGLDEVRILNRIRGQPLDAVGTAQTLAELTERFGYAFQPWKGGGFYKPALVPRVAAPGDCVQIAGMDVTLFDQDHGFARSLGIRIGKFAYSTDVVALDEAAFAALNGIEIWLVDCFQRARHPTHASLALVSQWAARLRPRRTVLTHMGPDMDWSWLRQNLPPGLEPAFDGLVIDFT